MYFLLAIVSTLIFVPSARTIPIVSSYGLIPTSFSTPEFISQAQLVENSPHPAVVENAIAESQLPPELLNPFYKNPAIAAGLAKESWLTNKEFPVHHREADKIPRSEIIKLISRLQHRR